MQKMDMPGAARLAMRPVVFSLALVGLVSTASLHARAQEAVPAAPSEAVRSAIERSLPLLERGSAVSRTKRECFTCHNQALPVLALAEARQRGFSVDEENLAAQLKHTLDHLKRGTEAYLKGRGQGGKADTAGYALWTLEAGGISGDETTAAVTEFLLTYDADRDHWRRTSKRPPSGASPFTTSYVSLRGLSTFGTDEQADRIAARRNVVREWLLKTEATETEDRVFRLWALYDVSADNAAIEEAAEALLSQQREDGGWAQLPDRVSDAYATGTVLTVLHDVGRLSPNDAAYQRGLGYLLGAQLDDGSWHVKTRSNPFQTYYESGFPHGDDQFISLTASSWATLALLYAWDVRR